MKMFAASRALVLASTVPLVTCASLNFIRDLDASGDDSVITPTQEFYQKLSKRVDKKIRKNAEERKEGITEGKEERKAQASVIKPTQGFYQKLSKRIDEHIKEGITEGKEKRKAQAVNRKWATLYRKDSAVVTEWYGKHMFRSTHHANLYRYVPLDGSDVKALCKAMSLYHAHSVPLRQNLVASCDDIYHAEHTFAMLSGAGEKTLSEFMQDWRAMGKPTRLLWLYIQQLVEAHDIIYKTDLSVTKDQMITMNLRRGPTIMQISSPKGDSAVSCKDAMDDLSDQLLSGVCGVDTKAMKEVEYMPNCLEGNRDKEHKGRLQSLVRFIRVDMRRGGCAQQVKKNMLERKKWVVESLDVKKRLEDFDATKEGFDIPL